MLVGGQGSMRIGAATLARSYSPLLEMLESL